MTTPIFTIESGIVSGMLIKGATNAKPEILYKTAVAFPYQEQLDIARLELAVISALDKVAEELAHKGLTSLEKFSLQQAVIVISAPWYSSENKSVTSSNRQPFKVKDTIVDDLVAQEIASFEKENEHGSSSSVIEKRVTDVKLNGYTTRDFKDKKASELQFCLYVSITPNEFKQKVEDTIHRYFSKGLPSWHTMPLVLFGSILISTPENSSFMVVEVGGELTEVLVVKNKVLTDTISFPYGVNTFMRRATAELHAASEINASLYKQYGENTLTGALKEKVDASLAILKNEWATELGKAFHQVSEGLLLPKLIYLKAESDFKAVFQKAIQEEGFAQTALADGPFEIASVDHLQLISIFINAFEDQEK